MATISDANLLRVTAPCVVALSFDSPPGSICAMPQILYLVHLVHRPLRHRESTAREERGWGRGFFRQIEPN